MNFKICLSAAAALTLLCLDASAQTVTNTEELLGAIANAEPGDTIELAAGTYRVNQNISVNRPGPVTLTGQDAVIEFDALEGFKVSAPDWTFQNLTIRGVCADDNDCEHAFHIVGGADNTTIRGCGLHDFNAQIKANGEGEPRQFPDNVLLEFNEFSDTRPRQTANPVTKIDVVGGRDWVIRHNIIRDFVKGEGNRISYGAFLKGNSRNGVFDSNFVACSNGFEDPGAVTIGLSLGGGGTSPDSICEDQSCTPEHQDGLLQNNIIANCSDVGIYINKGAGTSILNNTLVDTSGIDIRFDSSTAIIANNFVDGRVRERDSGTISDSSNNIVEIDPGQYFQDAPNLNFGLLSAEEVVDQGRDENVTHDFCGRARTAPLDIGALEYSLGAPCVIATNLEDLLDSKVPSQNNNNNPNNPNNTNSGTNSSNSNQTNGTNGSTDTNNANNTNSGESNNSNNQETFEDDVELENTGCGCASTDGPPWTIVILLIGFGLLRRKRTPLT
ncbi:hypothetical protein FRD01_05280 [Microvenator marinus]|uniref:Right handed beta helix domain-containing protein n=1 Tax=Microvenator marinus TaxID=2600177 RepID=A0A5B8XSQ5_9DELT|nr:right-handed parallel beta-helix repeat-containing protein [Microvenator marinus]QED26666.1 hypothetical protein FRD01_05280 [Microvenator marinus]